MSSFPDWGLFVVVLFTLFFVLPCLLGAWVKINKNKISKRELNIMNTEFKIAGIWSRIGGAIIDLIIVFIFCFLVMFSWFFMIGITDPLAASKINYETGEPSDLFVFLVIDYLYTAILQSGSKQGTWGQRAMGLQVIKIDGSTVTFGTASIRYFVSLISSILFKIGYVIAIFTEKKQTLHDLAAGVIVIRRFSNSEESSGSMSLPSTTASSPNTQPSAQPMANLNAKALTAQSTDEDIWAFASNEMNSRNRNEGLWAMCFASADGNQDKTKASYLKQRVEQLRLELKSLIEYENHQADLVERRRVAALGEPASCPKCGGAIRTTTDACNHCNAWLGGNAKEKPIPKNHGG